MYNRIIILALLFLASEKVNSRTFAGFLMTFSDALPVQFWPIDCATYNEHESDGVHYRCYCAPWECDDEIKVQFSDDVNQNFSLLIFDSEGVETDEIEIEEISPGSYQTSFVPSQNSPGFCEELIQLKIQQNAGFQGFNLPDLDEWQNDGGAGDPWTLGSNPSINTTVLGTSSERLYVDFAFIPGLEYNIIVNFTNTANTGGLFGVAVSDSSFNVQFSSSKSGGGVGANQSTPLTFVANSNTTRVYISLTFLGSTNTTTINSTESERQVGTDTIVAKSDCLDLKISHPNTVLARYYNHRNFAGLNYQTSSPDSDFYIRLPAIFFHQRFPEEDEVMELSSSLVTLNGTLRKQRLLETDYLPYYFHEKIKLILKHQFIEIFDKQWVKQEGYEILEGERRWPLKKAKCWLSEKNFVHRNIL
jgi:hypothetical protein